MASLVVCEFESASHATQLSLIDSHAVADLQAVELCGFEGAGLAVVEMHLHAIAHHLAVGGLLDLVTGHGATDRAEHGHRLVAVALAELVADDPAEHAA